MRLRLRPGRKLGTAHENEAAGCVSGITTRCEDEKTALIAHLEEPPELPEAALGAAVPLLLLGAAWRHAAAAADGKGPLFLVGLYLHHH